MSATSWVVLTNKPVYENTYFPSSNLHKALIFATSAMTFPEALHFQFPYKAKEITQEGGRVYLLHNNYQGGYGSHSG